MITRKIMEDTVAIMPQIIPAFAWQSPFNSRGFSLIRLMAIAPKIIANGPRIIPKRKKPTIPQTIDVIARQQFFGSLAGDVGEPIAMAAVGLAMVMEAVGLSTVAEAVGLYMMMMMMMMKRRLEWYDLRRFENGMIYVDPRSEMLTNCSGIITIYA